MADIEKLLEESEHPRVTTGSIEDKIADTSFIRHAHLTICVITMKNGFFFVGSAAPADARNYNPDIGEHYAYEDAFKKIWSHEGYLLRNMIHAMEE